MAKQTGKKTDAVPRAGCLSTRTNGMAVKAHASRTVEKLWMLFSRARNSHAMPRMKAILANSAGSKPTGPSLIQL